MLKRKVSYKQTILAGQNRKEKAYWLAQLSGITGKTTFPVDYAFTDGKTAVYESIRYRFPPSITGNLVKLSNNSDVRLHIILVAGLSVLLYKYTGKRDVLLSTPVYTSPHGITPISEVVPLRSQLHPDLTFKELLIHTRQLLIEADEHKNYPIDLLIDQLKPPFATGTSAAWAVLLILENIQNSLRIEEAQSDLVFSFVKQEQALSVCLTFHSGLYRQSTMERLLGHLTHTLGEALENPAVKIGQIRMLADQERTELLSTFNATQVADIADSLSACLEAQAHQHPNALALLTAHTQLTYRQLNERANQLARYLRKNGVQAHPFVGVLLPRSEWMIISLLAIIKAGAAYVPIDPTYPAERIKYILDDAAIGCLLSTEEVTKGLTLEVPTLCMEELQAVLSEEEVENLTDVPVGQQAYIIYTSGSTGKPKGIVIKQRSVLNLLQWGKSEFERAGLQGVLASTSVCFDLSVFEIFMPLTTGGTVILAENLLQLPAHPHQHRVTLINTVPSVLAELLKAYTLPSSVRVVNLAGEPLRKALVDDLYAASDTLTVYNLYGPSETTTYSTCEKLTRGDAQAPTIGKPIRNTQVYILDENRLPVPVGVTGEVYIGGAGVAQEYVNLPTLTEAMFLPNPFVAGEKMYKTGDLGRWQADGRIVYLGRMDHQVKIRGFRIELGEIENCLLSHPQVKEAIVIVKTHPSAKDDKYLCAFLTTRIPLSSPEVKAYVGTLLPGYMIPAHVIVWEAMPQTANGKVDRKALAELYVKPPARQPSRQPETDTQRKLGTLWKQVLLLEELGIDDNFFELGGHSLLAYHIIQGVYRCFQVEVPMAVFFKHPTIEALASCIEQGLPSSYAPIQPAAPRGYYPTSSPQRRIYISHQFDPEGISNNMSFVFRIEGPLEPERLEKGCKQLVARHESLRTAFLLNNDELVQQISDQVRVDFTYWEAPGQPPEALIRSFVRPFELGLAPLCRLQLVCVADQDFFLLMDMHHIISDGLSVEILMEELASLYRGEELPALAIQYKDFAVWQSGTAFAELVKKQEAYWLKEFAGEIPALRLPVDFPHSSPVRVAESMEFTIETSLLHQLRDGAAAQQATSFMVLFSAYAALLYKLSGQTDIVIGSSIDGRPLMALQQVVGMFVNAIALRVKPEGQKTFEALLAEVKQKVLLAYENQLVPFEELVTRIAVPRSGTLLYRTNFLYFSLHKPATQWGNVNVSRVGVDAQLGLYDLTLEAVETPDRISLGIEYNARLFKRETVEKWGEAYLHLLKQVLNQRSIALDSIEIVV